MKLKYLQKLREQHELKTAALNRSLAEQRKSTTNRHIGNSSTSSTINLLSQCSSTVNKSIKNHSNPSKSVYNSNQTSVSSLNNNPNTITTMNKLEMEVNYLELCHSS